MNTEERDLITKFVARVGGAPQGGFGSVPATTPNLPPIDPEADQYIGQMFQQYPEARYRVTQMAVVQEAALVAAQNRIQQLQWQLQQAQQALEAQQQRPAGGGGGLFGGLFGGGQRAQAAPPPGWGQQAAPPPPQPQQGYPMGMQPGMFPARGSGFLGSALTTAAGVAGGMMVGNALTDLFSGHHDGGGFGGGGMGGETVINNNYGAAPGGDPFGGAGTDVDPGFDAGGGGDGGFGGDWGGGGDDNF
ncbi:DUF2076 domain-containing protein [Gluconacetobacter aggeris]|uniref:DUF2076 domain-containing protein n=2 Tax=Gluconacetobacter TaxID=89583 RepID=A0A7W4IRV5_9PROT|nr:MULTISPECIES: DUF2076 domain-containing protein [Gluconacetobacter]MBB2167915.1 DUF2076 domain-containing protein [Gluconacetobacter aggeris]MBB2178869.1 DUF2076 domain-containing protein [Gluconacetobacter tumulicola]